MNEQEAIQQVAQWLAATDRRSILESAVAFTGAGISTESGIPDFRSPGGVWSRQQPVMYQDFLARPEARKEYWRQKCESHREFTLARPNDGHRVLARWEAAGMLWGVITQNIDGLHQEAGNRRVLELHGTNRAVGCLGCGARFEPEPLVQEFLRSGNVPDCPRCGGPLKHATVSFGQSLPADVLEEAFEQSRRCRVFLAIGTSLVVEPAASLPRVAKAGGARLVIINRDPTGQDRLADLALHAPIGRTLSAIDAMLEEATEVEGS